MAKILFVEDMEVIHDTAGMLLKEACGHEVISAYDGKQGLEKLFENPDIEIILSDYNMPVMNGYEFCKEIKTNLKYEKYSKIPIIGIGEFPEDKKEYLSELKQKPWGFTEIDGLIKKVLNKN